VKRRLLAILSGLVLALAPRACGQVITAAPDPNHPILSTATQAWADGLTGAPLTANNRFVLLENGVRSLPERLALIAGARQELFFTTMVAGYDTTGRQLAQALTDAVRRGVTVRCILDGQRTDPRLVHLLRQGGARVSLYNPFLDFGGRKHRFHQKLLVADLRSMVCGGMNASDAYLLGDGHNDRYKDTDVRVDGDGAAEASVVFLGQWLELNPGDQAARDLLRRAPTWGPLAVAGGPTARTGCARWLVQESDRGSHVIRDYYVRCIEAARRQVLWHVNNVIPTDALKAAMQAAAARGVRVAILTNSARANARRQGAFLGWFQTQYERLQLRRLRGTGVEVWELDVPLHSKALTVDGVVASIASYNFSSSSEKNLEAACVIYDPALVTDVEAMFERDLAGARRVQ
jgi:cardiolipin synthase